MALKIYESPYSVVLRFERLNISGLFCTILNYYSRMSRMTKELRQMKTCDFLVFDAKSSFRIFLMSMSIYKLNPKTLFGIGTLLRHKRLHR